MTKKFNSLSSLIDLKIEAIEPGEINNKSFLVKSSAQEICEHFEKFLYNKNDLGEPWTNYNAISTKNIFRYLIERMKWVCDRDGVDCTIELIEGALEKEKFERLVKDKTIPQRLGRGWKWGYSLYAIKTLMPFFEEWKTFVEKENLNIGVQKVQCQDTKADEKKKSDKNKI